MLPDVFPLGQIKLDPSLIGIISQGQIRDLLDRHATGDWGDVDQSTKESNTKGLVRGGQITSRYLVAGGYACVVRTAADRRSTLLRVSNKS